MAEPLSRWADVPIARHGRLEIFGVEHTCYWYEEEAHSNVRVFEEIRT